MEAQVNIYSPYEASSFRISNKVTLKPAQPLTSFLGLSRPAYCLSKRLYYNRVFSRMLFQSVGLSESLLFRSLSSRLKEDRAMAIQAEQDFMLPVALKLGRKLGIPVVADLHNISAEELVAAGVFEANGRHFQDLQSRMRGWLAHADSVCVVSKEMKQYVETEYNLPSSKVLLVPPGGRLRSNSARASPESKRVVYMGTVSYREHVDLFIQSIPFIRERCVRARFFATRKGEDVYKIRSLCKELGVEVSWFWMPNEDDLFAFLGSCAVGVLPSSYDKARAMGTPIKLFDYMSAGLPVVANDIGGWSRIIKEEKVGILTKDNPSDFSSSLIQLLQDGDLRRELSFNAIRSVREKYNWDNSTRPLAEFYSSCS